MPAPIHLVKNLVRPLRWRYHLATAAARERPSFIIVGGQKCGTSSLFDYLLAHPQMTRPTTKEIHYYTFNYPQTQAWYRAHFATQAHARRLAKRLGRPTVTGEASPYYLFHPQTPARIAKDLPDVKLIFLFRDPTDRAYSHFKHNQRRGHETLPFDQALALENQRIDHDFARMQQDPGFESDAVQHHSYRARGLYADQVTRYLEHFPREQCLFLCSEHMFADPAKTLAATEDFLGIDRFIPGDLKPSNQGGYKKQDAYRDVLQQLRAFYEPHNQRLFDLVGEIYPWPTAGQTG